MSSHDELYQRVYEQMNEQGEATRTEAWNETLRILEGVARGTINLRELDAQYGIVPSEIEGYDLSTTSSEGPEIEEEIKESREDIPVFDPVEDPYSDQEPLADSSPPQEPIKEPKRTGRRSLQKQADRLLE